MVYRAEPQRDKLSVESGEQVQRLKHPTSKRLDVLSWLEQQDRCDVFLAVMLDFFACHRSLCLYIYQVEMICAGVLIVQIDQEMIGVHLLEFHSWESWFQLQNSRLSGVCVVQGTYLSFLRQNVYRGS